MGKAYPLGLLAAAACAVLAAGQAWCDDAPAGPAPSQAAKAPAAAPASAPAADPNAVRLFDGKTLEGWEGNLKLFRVQDGAIVGGTLTEKIARNEFLCTTRQYGDFELRLKARLLNEDKGANAGVQFRTKRIPNHHEVSGYQADMARGIWGTLYDESRRRKYLDRGDPKVIAKAVRPGDWNELVIRCQGPRVQIFLNGTRTVDYTEADEKIERTGIIGLQIHGGPPSEAWYKDITIRELGGGK